MIELQKIYDGRTVQEIDEGRKFFIRAEFSENGQKYIETNYKDGKSVGQTDYIYYENGQKLAVKNHKNRFNLLILNIKIGHFKNVHFSKIDLTFYCKITIVE